jgi:hypothetical protein
MSEVDPRFELFDPSRPSVHTATAGPGLPWYATDEVAKAIMRGEGVIKQMGITEVVLDTIKGEQFTGHPSLVRITMMYEIQPDESHVLELAIAQDRWAQEDAARDAAQDGSQIDDDSGEE